MSGFKYIKGLFILIFISLSFIFCLTIVYSQTNNTLTIEKAVELALEHNHEYKTVLLSIKSQETVLNIQKNPFTPLNIDISGSVNQIDNIEKDNTYEADLSANVGIYASYTFTPTLFTNISIEEINLEKEKMEAESTKRDTISNTKLAFLNILVTKELHQVDLKSYERSKNYFEDINKRYELGYSTESDKIRAEINYKNHELTLKQTEIDLLNIKNTLYSMIGYDLIYSNEEDKTIIIGNFKYKPYVINLDEAIEKAIRENPNIIKLFLTKELVKKQLELINLSTLPNLGVSLGFNVTWNDSYNTIIAGSTYYMPSTLNYIFSISIEFSFPVDKIILPKTYEETQSIKYDLKEMDETIEAYAEALTLEIIDNHSKMKLAENRIIKQQEILNLSEELLSKAQESYDLGIIDFLELEKVETDYRKANLSYIQALYDYHVSKLKLQSTIGDIGGE